MDLLNNINQISPITLFIIYAWSIAWKGLALWKAAKMEQRNWFIVILILNTFGVIEITYLFYFAKKRMHLSEFKFWETNK
jgi:methionyl-tRNA synthetase